MSAIRTEGLRKDFGSVHAVDGLNLTVDPGTIFGFLGPNGAGKTTTIRMLTGLAKPSGGKGWVAGEEITSRQAFGTLTNNRQAAARIGYLPEDPAFYGWMSPVEFLDHIGRLFGYPAEQRKARTKALLEQAGLAQVQKRRIAGFSRGMRQRLGIAQALVNQPEVLFMDEPASALDPAGRKEVLDMIAGLQGQCTVFMSTHILADVERVCDTIGIIDHGKLVVEAPQAELLSRYSVPAFELECEPGSESAFTAWLESLKEQAWYSSMVAQNGNAARVVVKDVSAARQALLASAVQAGILLRRYEIVTPSLEDIFLKLVGEEQIK
jgi:ABC-2 type transport system ATP-binding protein